MRPEHDSLKGRSPDHVPEGQQPADPTRGITVCQHYTQHPAQTPVAKREADSLLVRRTSVAESTGTVTAERTAS
jgi:hypothetical protein